MYQNLKPFIKWAGGKRQLLPEITKRLPDNFNNYYEPFVGGGALFMHLAKNRTIINDTSKELMDSYRCIKKNPRKLIKELDIHYQNHLRTKTPLDYFELVKFWDRKETWNNENEFIKSARLIYLNKTCFNGLYRVNKQGLFNTPYNQKDNLANLYDRENILNIHNFLKTSRVKILNVDFEKACSTAKIGDFIFFDPPYDNLTEENKTFNGYSKEQFTRSDQIRLRDLAVELKNKGCYVMLTNHNTTFINDLYKDEFYFHVVEAKRSINANGKKRIGEEMIICSYKTTN